MRNPISVLLDLLHFPYEIGIDFALEEIKDLSETPVLDFTCKLLGQTGRVLLWISRCEQPVRSLQILDHVSYGSAIEQWAIDEFRLSSDNQVRSNLETFTCDVERLENRNEWIIKIHSPKHP